MNEDKAARICEIFKSLQGEVQGIGQGCLFIRFHGCNLGSNCPVNCDTPYSWKPPGEGGISTTMTIDGLVKCVREENTMNVVFTGGEPLIQQDIIVDVIEACEKERIEIKRWYIETNGTIAPCDALLVNPRVWFNVSPKILDARPATTNKLGIPTNKTSIDSNDDYGMSQAKNTIEMAMHGKENGEETPSEANHARGNNIDVEPGVRGKTFRPDVLEKFPVDRTVFKVVVGHRTLRTRPGRDYIFSRLHEFLKALGEDARSRTYLMPSARNREEYMEAAPLVASACIEHGFCFGPRLHLLLWDGKRGK